MAEGLAWFKLWASCLTDPSLDNLSVADFGRWVKILAFIRAHGNNEGEVILVSPAKTFCAMLQLPDFDTLCETLQRLPNVVINRQDVKQTNETICNVSFRNWRKYQVVTSTERVRRFRQNETYKSRVEKNRITPPPLSPRGGTFSIQETLKSHPALKGKR